MGSVDNPSPILPFFNEVHLHLGKDVRATGFGKRKIVHVERILRSYIASRHAIATIDALMFDDALAASTVDGDTFLVEVHGQTKRLNRLTQFRSSFLQGLELL